MYPTHQIFVEVLNLRDPDECRKLPDRPPDSKLLIGDEPTNMENIDLRDGFKLASNE
jgi:hypothetical protein